MTKYAIEDTTFADYDAIRLIAGDVDAVFLPSAGMVCVSLRRDGEEFLGRTVEFPSYVERGTTVGIPLLHPWANRLASHRYTAGGLSNCVLPRDSELLHYDSGKLPMHGVAGAYLAFEVDEAGADDNGAFISAQLDWTEPTLLEVFPFPHWLDVLVQLDTNGLTIETSIEPSRDTPVPLSFGYHPYLRIPAAPRTEWTLEMPPVTSLAVDDRMIPTGDEIPFPWNPHPLGTEAYDTPFRNLDAQATFAISARGRRVEIHFLEGYTHSQIFAPADRDFIAIEPMTAPANALVSGSGLRTVAVGDRFKAAFRVVI